MIPSPWRFEPKLTDQDLAKLGILMVRWSHIEHVLGNCLRVMLRLSDDEAVAKVFRLTLDERIKKIAKAAKTTPIHPHASKAFEELRSVMVGLRDVRNNVVHAVILEDDIEGYVFHLRSRGKNLTIEQVFSCEEITNYAAQLCWSIRLALGLKYEEDPVIREWPDRPPIPEFLQSAINFPKNP